MCVKTIFRMGRKPESKEKQNATMRRHYTTEKNTLTRKDYRTKVFLLWKPELEKRERLQCKLCGYDKNFAALDFHHRNSKDKKFGVSMSRPPTEDRLAELDKCDCLCSNCHREIHHPAFMK